MSTALVVQAVQDKVVLLYLSVPMMKAICYR